MLTAVKILVNLSICSGIVSHHHRYNTAQILLKKSKDNKERVGCNSHNY